VTGKELRKAVSRGVHATWNPDQRSEPIATLRSTAEDRLAHLNPIRFGRMLDSPLAFLRGAPLIMARDLASTPRTDIMVQACGDAHLLNFGLFASPERNLLFDLNDFDETLVGPWKWDVKRLATSIAVAARQYNICGDRCKNCVSACVRSYREHLDHYSSMTLLDVWYSRVDGDALFKVFPGKRNERLADTLDKAERRNNRQAVNDLTTDESGHLRFKDAPPVTTHATDVLSKEQLDHILATYRKSLQEDRRHLFDRYEVVDYALKVVGVGSVGTRCFAVLFRSSRRKDCIVLQIKESTPSVIEGLCGQPWTGNQGQRTVVGQRLIQGFSDIFLGWGGDGERDYYVRQLRDMKGQLDPSKSSTEELCSYAELCGWVLARAHARSGSASPISGYLGKSDAFDRAVGEFASLYADQTEKDFADFKAAVDCGNLPAEQGV
jgi:uncharacterized protein (DUF2252 family)